MYEMKELKNDVVSTVSLLLKETGQINVSKDWFGENPF